MDCIPRSQILIINRTAPVTFCVSIGRTYYRICFEKKRLGTIHLDILIDDKPNESYALNIKLTDK